MTRLNKNMSNRPFTFIFLLCLALLFLILSRAGFAQAGFSNTISGRITDASTGNPLFNVNVFLANTTRGAATDKDGAYTIKNIPPGAYDLIASMMGYELEIIPIQFAEAKSILFDIQLRPRVLTGEAVEVTAPVPKEWNNNLKRFQREFLGETENAKGCHILNPEVLDFKAGDEFDRFDAMTDSTIIVENFSLGYKLYIIILTFRINKDSLIYAIYPRFEELVPQNEKESGAWQKAREETYFGSFRHFISALARGKISEEYFDVFALSGHLMAPDQLNIISGSSASQKWFYLDAPVMVVYKGLSQAGKGRFMREYRTHFPASYILLRNGYAHIDTLGNVLSRFAIIHWGYWHKSRIADLLPYDYAPDEKMSK
ncbi:carboxypeptidase-like regulatory domain-containing protein [candidate division KSB1 bacterium]|nr:carboxypeptidase-like regulatory domain-containing protein [candidate division KSB1 bacterium]